MTRLRTLTECTVLDEWVDYNGHMNDAAYAIPFSKAVEAFIRDLSMDAGYRDREQLTIYTLENHIRYVREAFAGERLQVDMQLVDRDTKRAHVFLRLVDGDGAVRATSEQMLMVIDTSAGRPGRFRGEPLERLEAMAEADRALPVPKEIGRPIGIRRG
ncbi:thioesterase [Aquisalimonas sp. 2447]|uniref:thioesterase family protein n=1 Tax=Aquisalimonas sp. 2447 TaxID=2740807 RepID=UPI00143273A3|nr:thioesterase family protein [Aquisalimonas sp. 2447]QIT55823.1 thioesterase [Aquisalimonas sp. 2447]